MKKVLKGILKVAGAVVLTVLLLIVLSEVSPIYDFPEPEPFSGPDIFNPYRGLHDSLARADSQAAPLW
ncbi:MAG: hypothetical protein IJR34_04185, partial [Bacteroidales bacterium]|nr:hypothetical protein [Bacteroidales bacterium]